MVERTTDLPYTLGRIEQQLDTITKTLSDDRSAAAQYRTDIRREIAAHGNSINAVATDVALAKKDISEMKPKVDSLEQRAFMSKGAANLAIVLGKVGHIISAGIGGIIAVLIERWIRGAPH